MAKTLYSKKKTTRNILIGVIAVLVIALVVCLIVMLRKDGAGMNCFQRQATAASADGVKINMSEYRMTLDMALQSYQNGNFTDEQIRSLQENAAKQALLQKICVKEAKALGITLTDEQKKEAAQTAKNQIESLKQYYTENLSNSGSYSKTALDGQIANYYNHIGMSEGQYYNYIKENTEANYYGEALKAYYEENGIEIEEDVLLDFYRKYVEDSMVTKKADGTESKTYLDGQYWYTLMLYQMGYSVPMLYVPEGFIYVDFIKLEKGSVEEINQIINEVNNGDRSFDELLASDENKDTFRDMLKGPYPIAEKDHSGLYTSDEAFSAVSGLEIGQIGTYVEEPKTAEDGTTTVTAYLFRRAKGDMCMDGETGVIKIDYYPDIRESVIDEYRSEQWLSDVRYEDAIYAYKGALG